jgi:hypothetical protein
MPTMHHVTAPPAPATIQGTLIDGDIRLTDKQVGYVLNIGHLKIFFVMYFF